MQNLFIIVMIAYIIAQGPNQDFWSLLDWKLLF